MEKKKNTWRTSTQRIGHTCTLKKPYQNPMKCLSFERVRERRQEKEKSPEAEKSKTPKHGYTERNPMNSNFKFLWKKIKLGEHQLQRIGHTCTLKKPYQNPMKCLSFERVRERRQEKEKSPEAEKSKTPKHGYTERNPMNSNFKFLWKKIKLGEHQLQRIGHTCTLKKPYQNPMKCVSFERVRERRHEKRNLWRQRNQKPPNMATQKEAPWPWERTERRRRKSDTIL